ncbi:hypothetical protein GCM10023339_18000 [Alloalcanivorax gelatiniphagus]
MTTQPHPDLREELDALAHAQSFSPDPSAWDRGRRARRRARIARGAAALAAVAVVAGAGTLAVRPSAVGPADHDVPDGAIPSVIAEPPTEVVTDLRIGRASVAYVSPGSVPVVVDAATGESHVLDLPDFPTPEVFELAEFRRGPWLALSPDGRRLAYPTSSLFERDPGQFFVQTAWYRVVDLTTGESDLVDLPPSTGTPLAMSWDADGRIAVDVFGRATKRTSETNPPPAISWTIDPATGDSATAALTGVVAPGQGISATYPESADPVQAVPFVTSSGTDPELELPVEDYPDGAVVTPVGWADNSLLVAQVDDDLVLLASPDRQEAERTWRVLVADAPESISVSLAVDLVPDLDGSADQELTHDFGRAAEAESAGPDRLPYVLGGLMALLTGVAFVRMVQQQA